MNTIIERQSSGSIRSLELCDWLTAHGLAVITTEECAHLLGVPRSEVPQRLVRPRLKGHFVPLARGLWVAVPATYRAMKAPDPMYYIDDLMTFYGCDYCIGWLWAAALRGASHQAPQVSQVAVARNLNNRTIGRAVIEFHTRGYVGKISKSRMSFSTGYATVASAGATMLMAASDHLLSGGINNVSTIVIELAEENPGYLSDVVSDMHLFSEAAVCRLGWMLDRIAQEDGLDELKAFCQATGEPAMLSPYGPRSGKIDKKWNVIVNREVDPDV